MSDSEMLAQILLKMNSMERELTLLRVAVCQDEDGDGSSVPEGFDEQEINGYVISQTENEGSNRKTNPVMYLFSGKMDKKTLTVYPSHSHLLPLFMQEKVDWKNGQYEHIVDIRKPSVIKSGDYHECPAFKVWRKHGKLLENGKTKKDLEKVSWMSPDAQFLDDEIARKRMGVGAKNANTQPAAIKAEQSAAPKTLRFANGDDAIKWAATVEIKAANEDFGVKKFESEKDAKQYYDIMKSEWKPSSAADMFNRWAAHIQAEVSIKWAVAKKHFPDEIECRKVLAGDYADDVDAKTKISAILREHIAKKKAA